MDELFQYIAEQTKGFFPPNDLEEFFRQIEREEKRLKFTSGSRSNLERIIKSIFDLRAFVSDALKYAHYVETLSAIAHNSNYLTDVIVRNPSLVYSVLIPSQLLPDINEAKLEKEIATGFSRIKSYERRVKFLRKLKDKHMLILGAADLLGMKTPKAVFQSLSILAKQITRSLFEISLDEVLNRKKIKTKINYVIASLGKLGGNELNYSSDIDLIFFFDKNRKFKESGLYAFEILNEAITLFAMEANKQTINGFLYRVDFRLRPDGKYSLLAKSYKDYLYYYETRGESWERQMLLKLSFLSGDKSTYDKFYSGLLPFVFPSSLPRGHLQSVAKMKSEIEKNARGNCDIKRFSGGIRDIEFSIQALQILNGKRFPELREPNTLAAIEKLKARNLLSGKEAEVLSDNYKYYRKIEHYLQLTDNLQTHTIPNDSETLQKLYRFLGFNSEEKFRKDLNARRKAVRKIFESIVLAGEKKEEDFEAINFRDTKKARKNLRYIFKGENLSGAKEFDKITLAKASEIEPAFKDALKRLRYPDRALENFAKILYASKMPSVLLSEMKEEKFLETILFFCESSEKFVAKILERPIFIDALTSRIAFLPNYKSRNDIAKNKFFALVRFLSKVYDANETSRFISEIYLDVISELSDKFFGDEIFVIALGSLGAKTMNFSSDLDLIIFSANSGATLAIQKQAEKFILELKRKDSGVSIDFRLRPEGESSQIVWDLEEIKNYFNKRISAWELLALAKARFVAGNFNYYEKFVEIYLSKISELDKDVFLSELIATYRKLISHKSALRNKFDLKFSHGALTTLDFIALPQILISKDKNKIRNFLYGESEINSSANEIAKKYRTMILLLQATFNTSRTVLPYDDEKKSLLNYVAERLELSNIYENLSKLKSQTVKMFSKIYG